MAVNPAQMAAGGQMAGGAPMGNQPPTQATVTPNNTATTQITEVLDALKKIIQQTVTPQGYVDMQRLISLWPQFSRIPFQVVMQMLQQNPEMLNELVSQYGLNGIIINGRTISADELAGIGTGAAGKGM